MAFRKAVAAAWSSTRIITDARYPDVQQQCPGNLQCALQHWLDYGIEMGRQGSPDFNVVSYMNRYGDVPRTLAPEDDPDALEHWLTVGADAGRDGSPAPKATGPFSPPTRFGGGGGSPWNDAAQCQNTYVVGFRLSVGKRVDGIQFLTRPVSGEMSTAR